MGTTRSLTKFCYGFISTILQSYGPIKLPNTTFTFLLYWVSLKKKKKTTVNNLEIVKNIMTDKNNNNNKTDYENNDDNQHMQFILL